MRACRESSDTEIANLNVGASFVRCRCSFFLVRPKPYFMEETKNFDLSWKDKATLEQSKQFITVGLESCCKKDTLEALRRIYMLSEKPRFPLFFPMIGESGRNFLILLYALSTARFLQQKIIQRTPIWFSVGEISKKVLEFMQYYDKHLSTISLLVWQYSTNALQVRLADIVLVGILAFCK